MEKLIPVINKLQDVFKRAGRNAHQIELPQIVVVGSQSSGKSSVLESLVGNSFLPRGSGIVTRCPIILQLTHIETSSGEDEWYCTFDHDDDKQKHTDFEAVREAIEKRTDELAAYQDKGISETPIIIKVFSSKVIPLTVVDLPGIVKNPVGSQPENIEELVETMINKYISNPNAIILAVSPANTDIATSESIKLAGKVDPNKERTVAVVTKLDLMDKGTDAKKVLAGEVIPMKLGIIGVINRSQQDIQDKKAIDDAMKDEKRYLEENYPYEKATNGSAYLAKKLNDLLMRHIQASLPALKKKITELIETNEQTMKSFGAAIPSEDESKKWFLDDKITEFMESFKTSVLDSQPDQYRISGKKPFAAKLGLINGHFGTNLRSLENIHKEDLTKHIKMALANSANFECFTSLEGTFKRLAKEQIRHLETHCITVAIGVHDILVEVVDHSFIDRRLGDLNSEISRIMRKLLEDQLKLTKESVREYIAIQSGMIFSLDEDFRKLLKVLQPTQPELETTDADDDSGFDEDRALQRLLDLPVPVSTHGILESISAALPFGSLFDKAQTVPYVKNLIETYCGVMQKQIADYIPKHIFHHLFNKSVEKMKQLMREGTSGREKELISEPERVLFKRKETEEMLLSLHRANAIISSLEVAA